MCDKNPFKVGDLVELKSDDYGFLARGGFKLNYPYTVKEVDTETDRLYVEETLGCLHYTHYTHFEFYKDPEKQPVKTKRIPFSEEAYNKYKDVAKVWLYGKECERFTFMVSGQSCVGDGEWSQGYALFVYKGCKDVSFHSVWSFELEIPVTTKRIPFDASRKDANVFNKQGNPVKEWYVFSNGVVAVLPVAGDFLSAQAQDDLEMEIEE